MDCDACREAISALFDGEVAGGSPGRHLEDCLACREWQAAASALNEVVRAAAPPVPDLTDAVLARLRWSR